MNIAKCLPGAADLLHLCRRSSCCTRAWAASACGRASREAGGGDRRPRLPVESPRLRQLRPHHPAKAARLSGGGSPLVGRVLAAAGIDRCVLVGHSDGGTIALLAAARDEIAGLEGVVTMAAHIFVEDISIKGIVEEPQAIDEGKYVPAQPAGTALASDSLRLGAIPRSIPASATGTSRRRWRRCASRCW